MIVAGLLVAFAGAFLGVARLPRWLTVPLSPAPADWTVAILLAVGWCLVIVGYLS